MFSDTENLILLKVRQLLFKNLIIRQSDRLIHLAKQSHLFDRFLKLPSKIPFLSATDIS